MVHRVGHAITNILGDKRVVLKSDQEPGIKKLKATVRREYSLEAPDEYSAVGDSYRLCISRARGRPQTRRGRGRRNKCTRGKQ